MKNTKTIFIAALVTAAIGFAGIAAMAPHPGPSVTMCHKILTRSRVPQCTTITVDSAQVQSHLTHGDFIGPCGAGCKPVAP